jgi:hypothetical protein
MEDTPEHVKKIWREIWLSKPVKERVRLAFQNNEDVYAIYAELKRGMAKNYPPNQEIPK